MLFEDHERAVIYKDLTNIHKILQAEIADEHIERLPDVQEEREKILVMSKRSQI
jgi:hypothetical protein